MARVRSLNSWLFRSSSVPTTGTATNYPWGGLDLTNAVDFRALDVFSSMVARTLSWTVAVSSSVTYNDTVSGAHYAINGSLNGDPALNTSVWNFSNGFAVAPVFGQAATNGAFSSEKQLSYPGAFFRPDEMDPDIGTSANSMSGTVDGVDFFPPGGGEFERTSESGTGRADIAFEWGHSLGDTAGSMLVGSRVFPRFGFGMSFSGKDFIGPGLSISVGAHVLMGTRIFAKTTTTQADVLGYGLIDCDTVCGSVAIRIPDWINGSGFVDLVADLYTYSYPGRVFSVNVVLTPLTTAPYGFDPLDPTDYTTTDRIWADDGTRLQDHLTAANTPL